MSNVTQSLRSHRYLNILPLISLCIHELYSKRMLELINDRSYPQTPNHVTGSYEERGMAAWRQRSKNRKQAGGEDNEDIDEDIDDSYELPLISRWLRRQRFSRFVPVLPGFKGFTHMFPETSGATTGQTISTESTPVDNTNL